MPVDAALEPLVRPLHDLVRWLRDAGVPHVIVGGVAAGLLGRPRATRDIDVVVALPERAWDGFLADATAHGFSPRQSNAIEFARKSRVFLLTHRATRLGIDVCLGAIAFEHEMIRRARSQFVEGIDVPLATPEDLIIMKSLAMRPTDVTDITSLIDAHPRIDLRRIRRCVREMADALETPEIAERLEAVLPARRRKPRAKKPRRRR